MLKDFLDKIKIGDKVIVSNRYYEKILQVSRLTKTMIILSDGSRYGKDGWPVGQHDAWSSLHLIEATPENLLAFYKKFYKNRIKEMVSNDVLEHFTINELKSFYDLLNSKKDLKIKLDKH